jgi:hypothetical protein
MQKLLIDLSQIPDECADPEKMFWGSVRASLLRGRKTIFLTYGLAPLAQYLMLLNYFR